MKKYLLSVCSICAMSISLVGHAHAQSMDYGSLQELFGESVTTNATGTPQRASDVAADMTIITTDQIRQSGSRSIPEIIGEYVSGVDVMRVSSGGYDVGVRGYQQPFQPRMLVLVDGRQVFIDDYSRTIWANIPVNVDDIRQIEVVKGPASALFGSNAASGVINIITYSPVHDTNNVAAISLGTQNTLTGDATVTKNGEWGGTKFSAGGLNADAFGSAIKASDAPPVKPYHRYIINSTEIPLSSTVTATGEVSYADSKQGTVDPLSYSVDNEHTITYSMKGGLGWQSKIGQINGVAYLNHTVDSLASGSSSTLTHFDTQLIVAQLNDQFKLGAAHTFRVGVEYRHKDFSFSGPKGAEDNYAGSATWLWQMADNLSWTNSLRVDHQDAEQVGDLPSVSLFNNADYSHAINTWSANSALAYKPTDNDTFHLSYGRGVQLPSLLNTYSDLFFPAAGFNPNISITGNPQLKPTITQSYELGYDRKIAPLYSTAKISVFDQLSQDIVGDVNMGYPSNVHGTTVLLVEQQNLGNSSAYGGELELLGNHNGFRWDASYSLAHVTDSNGVATNLNYQGSTPEHHFRLNGGYTWKQWEFDANSQLVTSSKMLGASATGLGGAPFPVSGYMTVGGRIGYNINDKYTVAVSGSSINRHYIDSTPFPNTERQAFVTLTGKF